MARFPGWNRENRTHNRILYPGMSPSGGLPMEFHPNVVRDQAGTYLNPHPVLEVASKQHLHNLNQNVSAQAWSHNSGIESNLAGNEPLPRHSVVNTGRTFYDPDSGTASEMNLQGPLVQMSFDAPIVPCGSHFDMNSGHASAVRHSGQPSRVLSPGLGSPFSGEGRNPSLRGSADCNDQIQGTHQDRLAAALELKSPWLDHLAGASNPDALISGVQNQRISCQPSAGLQPYDPGGQGVRPELSSPNHVPFHPFFVSNAPWACATGYHNSLGEGVPRSEHQRWDSDATLSTESYQLPSIPESSLTVNDPNNVSDLGVPLLNTPCVNDSPSTLKDTGFVQYPTQSMMHLPSSQESLSPGTVPFFSLSIPDEGVQQPDEDESRPRRYKRSRTTTTGGGTPRKGRRLAPLDPVSKLERARKRKVGVCLDCREKKIFCPHRDLELGSDRPISPQGPRNLAPVDSRMERTQGESELIQETNAQGLQPESSRITTQSAYSPVSPGSPSPSSTAFMRPPAEMVRGAGFQFYP